MTEQKRNVWADMSTQKDQAMDTTYDVEIPESQPTEDIKDEENEPMEKMRPSTPTIMAKEVPKKADRRTKEVELPTQPEGEEKEQGHIQAILK